MHPSLHMHVRKKMILAVFVVAVALGAESELELRVGLLGSAADGAFVSCYALGRYTGVLFKFCSSHKFFGLKTIKPPCLRIEKEQIDKLEQDHKEYRICSLDKSVEYSFKAQHNSIEYSEILDLNGYDEHEQKLQIRIAEGKG